MHAGKKLSSLLLLLLDVLLFLTIIGLGCLVGWLGKQVRSQPEILEIRADGTAQWYEDPIKLQEDYIPTDAVYEKTLKDFVRGMRMVEKFFDTNQELVLNALFCSTGKAYEKLSASLEAQNPFEVGENMRIDVPENSIRVTKVSQSQWKVSWRERTYNKNGEKTMEADYEAVFHTTLGTVRDTGGANSPKDYNPLGIFVYDYDIDLLRKLM